MNATLRRHRLVQHLHLLGERAVDELLSELDVEHGIADDILARLERYARLDPSIAAALGADRIAPRPLLLVAGARS
jgi:hypothetical protein